MQSLQVLDHHIKPTITDMTGADTMTNINTATEARAIILNAMNDVGRDEIRDQIVQFNNTAENDIDALGDVWVANPQTGHWLSDEHLIEFANFLTA